MEQGPVLAELALALAPVAAISGQTRLTVSIFGSQVGDASAKKACRRRLSCRLQQGNACMLGFGCHLTMAQPST